MINKRFIKTAALLVDNKLIPFWELEYVKNNTYGEYFNVKDKFGPQHQELIEIVYDLKKKIFAEPIILTYNKNPEFEIGETVYIEQEYPLTRHIKEDVVAEIIYTEYKSDFKLGKKLEKWEINNFKIENPLTTSIYELRTYEPFYKMESGEVVKWDYKLYRKVPQGK